MSSQLAVSPMQIAEFCQRNQICRLALFGSVLRADFRSDSDINVLVEFEPDARVNYFRFVDIQDELATIFKRAVDLHTPQSLSQHFRQRVLDFAEVLYERERQHVFA